MSYTDQQMSGNRLTALIIVALIHVVVGYALVTGLAETGFKQVMKHITTVNIEKDKPKPPPPPPPPKNLPPPPKIVAPPPAVNIAPQEAPRLETRPSIGPVSHFSARGPAPKTSPSTWVTTEDYPPRALREMRSGTTSFRLSVAADGRVTGCEVTGSSGQADLDQATCTYAVRRARLSPALDGEGQPTSGTYNGRVKWVPQNDDE